MRNGQKRMRGRNNNNNHRKSQNPLTRVYESNGPDVKIRGTASHIAEKYIQLARDSQSSGDPVAAENYYQHAEHYFRLIAAAQEQFRQQNPYYNTAEAAGPGRAARRGRRQFRRRRRRRPALHGPERAELCAAAAGAAGAAVSAARRAAVSAARSAADSRLQQQPQQQPYAQTSGRAAMSRPDPNALPSFITGGGQPQPQAAPNPNRIRAERPRAGRRPGPFRPSPAQASSRRRLPPATVRIISATPIRKARAPKPSEGGDEPRQPE